MHNESMASRPQHIARRSQQRAPYLVAIAFCAMACDSGNDSTPSHGDERAPDVSMGANHLDAYLNMNDARGDVDATCGQESDCVDADVTDGGLESVPDMRVDMHPPDAAPPEPIPFIEDPLLLPQDTFFRCDDTQIFRTPARVWRMTDTQYQRQLDRMIRGESKNTLEVSNPFAGLHSGEQFSQLAN